MHNRTVTRGAQLVLLSFAIGLGLAIAYLVRSALLVIYVSAVFAVVLTPAVNAVHRISILGWKPSRGRHPDYPGGDRDGARTPVYFCDSADHFRLGRSLVHNYPKDSRIYVAE